MGLEREVIDPATAADPLVITGVNKGSLLSKQLQQWCVSDSRLRPALVLTQEGPQPVSLEGQLGASQPREETCPSSCPTRRLIQWSLRA